MILACPSCKARYLVPAAHFAAGPRVVKCARCSHTWLAEMPPEMAAEQLAAAAPPPVEKTEPVPPAANLPVVREEPRAFRKLDLVLAALVLAIAALLLVLALDRKDIARQWPATKKYYDMVGLHIYLPGEGLSLQKVRSEMRFEGGATQLEVEGEVHNETSKPQPIPDILAAAIGPDDKPMQSWQIDAPAATVEPGESVPFSSAIHAPDGTVVEIKLDFAEPKDAP